MILVIGYGNPLYRDDGLGQEVVRRLVETLNTGAEALPAVSIIHCCRLTPELARRIGEADSVIFVNATPKGRRGGISRTMVARSPGAQPYTHSLTPAALMHGVCSMYDKCPDAYLFSVGGATFDYGDWLSPEIETTIPALLRAIVAHINYLAHRPVDRTKPNRTHCPDEVSV